MLFHADSAEVVNMKTWPRPFTYPTALSFVSYLDKEYGRARVLWLVSLLAERRLENDAFREAFGSPREEIVAEWGQSLKRRASP